MNTDIISLSNYNSKLLAFSFAKVWANKNYFIWLKSEPQWRQYSRSVYTLLHQIQGHHHFTGQQNFTTMQWHKSTRSACHKKEWNTHTHRHTHTQRASERERAWDFKENLKDESEYHSGGESVASGTVAPCPPPPQSPYPPSHTHKGKLI